MAPDRPSTTVTAPLALLGVTQSASHGIALHMAGEYTRWQGDTSRGDALVREALGTFRAAGDRRGEAESLAELARSAMQQGDYMSSVRLHEDSLAVARELGDASQLADRLLWMGRALRCAGEAVRGRVRLSEALAAFQRLGNTYGIAVTTEFLLGEAAEAAGDDREAQIRYTEALALYQEVGDQPGIGTVNTYLGRLAMNGDDQEEARRRFRERLRVATEIGFRLRLCDALDGLAALAAAESQLERALRLAGVGANLRQTAGLATPPHERAWLAERLARARQALSLEEAVAEALGEACDA